MLGEKIGEMSGKINSQRVLSVGGEGLKMETSFQANGSLLGTNVKETGTYWTVVHPDGTHYGEGQGATMTKDGKMATWKGHGVGVTKKRRGSELSRCYLLSNYAVTMVPAEQSRRAIRIRSRRRRQHTLRILGMEVGGSGTSFA
jgi:hypothetical protein